MGIEPNEEKNQGHGPCSACHHEICNSLSHIAISHFSSTKVEKSVFNFQMMNGIDINKLANKMEKTPKRKFLRTLFG
jgi:hypothetical protein